MPQPKVPPQIVRLILLTLGIVGSYLVAKYFLTPASFGEYGWYRSAALTEIASRTPVYAGKKACEECHSEQVERLAKYEHKTLSCESCHGVSSAHAGNPDIPAGVTLGATNLLEIVSPAAGVTNIAPIKLTGSHCIRCHEANPSRPAWLKQIVVKTHYSGKCTECHVPHQPNEVP